MPDKDLRTREWNRIIATLLVAQTALLGVFATVLALQPVLFVIVALIVYTAACTKLRRFFLATPEEKEESEPNE